MFNKLYIEGCVCSSDEENEKISLLLPDIDVIICDDIEGLSADDYNNSVFAGKTSGYLDNAGLHGCGVIAVLGTAMSDKLFSYKYAVESIFAIDYEYLEMIYARLHNMQLIISQTKQFIIKEMSIADAKIFYQVAEQNPDLFEEDLGYAKQNRNFDVCCKTVEELAAAYVENVYDLYGYGIWSIYLTECELDKPVGFVGIYDFTIDSEGYRGISYYIDCEYRGYSLAGEAVNAVLEYCKNILGINEIHCLIEISNSSSIRVAEKCGFTFAKKVRENNYLLYLRKL